MYVLKAFWNIMPVYYVGSTYDENGNFPLRKLSKSIKDAAIFKTELEAIETLEEINDSLFKVYPVCPKCGIDYNEHPALSRDDDKTLICPTCGIKEAINQYIKYKTSN